MYINIPNQVKTALHTLSNNGFQAYIVGGCVRDSLLSIVPPDWDIATSAKPSEILKVFKRFKTIETGIIHGTVTVIINDMPLEITTFRIDGDYKDNRHPESVEFCCNLSEDLKRRDFTINSMAYNENNGLIDIFNSQSDLKNKLIKCVGNPDKRFTEDALRILRALRFSSVLGFEIDQETSDSIHKNAYLLNNVSKERIASELLKLLCGDNIVDILLNYRDVIAVIIPELEPTFDFDQKTKYHIFDVYKHIVYAVGFSEPDPTVRLSLLLHDIAKPQCFSIEADGLGHAYGHGDVGSKIAGKIVKRLKLSRQMLEDVMFLIKFHDYPIEPTEKNVKRCLNKFSLPVLQKLLKIKTADILAHDPKYVHGVKEIEKTNEILDSIIEDGKCFKIKDLDVNGNDLKQLGIPEGRPIGNMLQKLLYCVIDDKVDNNKNDLLNLSKEIYGGIKNEHI